VCEKPSDAMVDRNSVRLPMGGILAARGSSRQSFSVSSSDTEVAFPSYKFHVVRWSPERRFFGRTAHPAKSPEHTFHPTTPAQLHNPASQRINADWVLIARSHERPSSGIPRTDEPREIMRSLPGHLTARNPVTIRQRPGAGGRDDASSSPRRYRGGTGAGAMGAGASSTNKRALRPRFPQGARAPHAPSFASFSNDGSFEDLSNADRHDVQQLQRIIEINFIDQEVD
jgi:hypothetical protein